MLIQKNLLPRSEISYDFACGFRRQKNRQKRFMNMEIIKKYKWLPVIVLTVLAGGLLFFYRFYGNDIKALKDFLASYEAFDRAISDLLISQTDDLESQAGDAFIELDKKAALRLSSLIKNDAELMGQALEVANFSRRELDSLLAYKGAIQSQNADLDGLAKEHGDLSSGRKAAYARFRELARLKD